MEVPLILLKWVKNLVYYSNHLQHVVCAHTGSMFCLGFPMQGSILGFFVYMNGLVSVPLSKGCEIVMFADNTLMFKPITGILLPFELILTI